MVRGSLESIEQPQSRHPHECRFRDIRWPRGFG